ncbi:hypothetical protein, variant [Blastomyces dermatitidis ATCC 26199]|nr:hypothetical protein BDFG_04646 [Blastomyces dermatitidis ATCC 26199]EQL33203.1 hypothetical protein, variant [Blastomyces dermatitidis ATCC 26199]
MDILFATLTPANDIAKMAFSDAYDTIARGQQGASTDTTVYRIRVASEQEYDADVLLFQREMDRKLSEGDISESLTEPDTDTELESRHLGMIWKGHYVLGFQHHPSAPNLGWVVGKRVVERGPYAADIFLCTGAFAKRHSLNLRSFHARFNFDLKNRAFFIASITSSPSAGLAVNSEVVGRQIHALNQHCMKIRVNSLVYNFQYTDFAPTEEFIKQRKRYLTATLEAPSAIFDMPTPHRNTRTIGQWTLNDPLGKGSAGRVFLASDSKNQVVAIKIMQCTSKSAGAVDMEIAR